jgi:pimeloyl-ACP methyl ester carboxylesterase
MSAMRSPQPERRIASDRGEIVYHAFGSGPPILFANGLGASWHVFLSQIGHLADRYRCLVWDYRGLYAESPGTRAPAPAIADHARDALAILEHEGASRAAVIGWSLGVQVALQLFAEAPTRVALLLLVGGGARASWGMAPEAGALRRLYPNVFALLARAPGLVSSLVQAGASSPETFTWARRIGLIGPGVDAELFAEVARNVARLDVDNALKTLREMAQHDLSHVLPGIDVPTLVIGGDRDPFTSRAALERLVQRISGAEYLLLPGASHYFLLDHAQHVNLRIDKFFAERGFVGQPRGQSLHPK